jgi:uncharacterized protein YcbX
MVSGLWRYPVKSFGGERARHVFVGPYGLTGDRTHAIVGADGGVLTARRASAMLGFRAHHGDPEGAADLRVSCPDGRTLAIDDPALGEAVGRELGREATMARSPVGVFDAAPLHLVTDASLRRMDAWLGRELDVARFRPNVVVELEEPEAFAEAGWVGRHLALGGGAVAEVVSPTERCAVTTFDPDTLERDNRVLAGLARETENLLGVYALVARSGWIEVGAPIRTA